MEKEVLKKVMLTCISPVTGIKLPIGWVEFNPDIVNPEDQVIAFTYENNTKKIVGAMLHRKPRIGIGLDGTLKEVQL